MPKIRQPYAYPTWLLDSDSIVNMIVTNLGTLSVTDGQGRDVNAVYPGCALHKADGEETHERMKASLKEVKTKVILTTDA